MEKTKVNWISVRDRLPEKNDDVMIYTSDGRLLTYAWFEGGIFNEFRYFDSLGIRRSMGDCDDECVTHWIPTLELPNYINVPV